MVNISHWKKKKITQKRHHLKSCILSYICCHLSLSQMQVRIKKNGRNCVPLGDGGTENDGDLKFQSVHNVILPWIQNCDLTVFSVHIWRSPFGFSDMGLILVLLDFHFMCNCSLKFSRWWMLHTHMTFFVFCKPELTTTIILKLSTVFCKTL